MYARAKKPFTPKSSPQMKTFPAADAGWISNRNLAAPDQTPQGASVLDNIFPTATGGRIRRGSALYTTVGAGSSDISALFGYSNGPVKKLFASDAAGTYDISSSTPATVPGMPGGQWYDTQFATSGGVFTVAVNGNDSLRIFDGTTFLPVGSGGVKTLAYDGGTSAFQVGDTVHGGTSGATGSVALINATTGTTGALYLADVTGTFQDNEALTSSHGAAVVNGTAAVFYNGITGISTSSLTYVCGYKSRLFFVEKNSMRAWFLPIDSIGGTLKPIELGGDFSLGGTLLFGATWSRATSGSGGLSDQIIFVSSEGQIAVYQGNDPESASDWSRVGIYRVGKPLGPRAWMQAGGDIIIATTVGMVSVSLALQIDYAALTPASVSYPIEEAWNDAVQNRSSSRWSVISWPENQMVLVSPSIVTTISPDVFVANAKTGAWCKFTNWPAKCFAVYNGRLFFGAANGQVIEANVSGTDRGVTYTAVYAPLFDNLGAAAEKKIARVGRVSMRGPLIVEPKLSVMSDYIVSVPVAPSAAMAGSASVWGTGVWGSAVWSAGRSQLVTQKWIPLGGAGYALAPCLQITSGNTIPLDTEIISIGLTYETAGGLS